MKTLSESIIGRRGTYLGGTPVVFWNEYDPADVSIVLDMPRDVISVIEQSDEKDYTLEIKNLNSIHVLYMSDEPDCVAIKDTKCRLLNEFQNKFESEYNRVLSGVTVQDFIKSSYKYEIHVGDAYIPIGSVLAREITKSIPITHKILDVFDSIKAWEAWIEFIWNMPDATSITGPYSFGYAIVDLGHKKVLESSRSDITVRIETFKEFGRHNERYGN